jgi:hypothetical protein
MHYCHLAIKVDGRLMFRKFNIMNISDQDIIILEKPYLSAMNPDIDWAKDTLQLPSTSRSLPPKPRKKVSIEEEDPE